ncbi:Uncharacterised protein g3295 [Pycnogonum litorale]
MSSNLFDKVVAFFLLSVMMTCAAYQFRIPSCTQQQIDLYNISCTCMNDPHGDVFDCANVANTEIKAKLAGKLPTRQHLVMRNMIRNIPAEFLKGVNIQELHLTNSKVSTIDPQAFVGFENSPLKIVFLETRLPNLFSSAFSILAKLETLKISGNQVRQDYRTPITVTSTDIARLPTSLTHLELINCQIRNIDAGAFTRLRNLQRLNLNSNRLTSLKANTFPNGSVLLISLKNNQLSRLPVEALSSLNGIISYFDNNQITDLPSEHMY